MHEFIMWFALPAYDPQHWNQFSRDIMVWTLYLGALLTCLFYMLPLFLHKYFPNLRKYTWVNDLLFILLFGGIYTYWILTSSKLMFILPYKLISIFYISCFIVIFIRRKFGTNNYLSFGLCFILNYILILGGDMLLITF